MWCLSPGELNGIANIVTSDPDVLPMFLDEDDLSTADEVLEAYKGSRMSTTGSGVGRSPAAAISIRTNKRIQAQLGVFTIHHADMTPLEDCGTGSHLWRFIIPTASKGAMLDELRRLGVTNLTLFPDLDNVCEGS